MRTSKYNLSASEETLYFDQFFQGVIEGSDFRQSKHIYLGESRIATRLSLEKDNVSGTNFDYERVNTYYYHPDHLGSAQFVTDHEGEKYEHLEYTPYGELWEEQTDPLADVIPFRFTGKEYDEETGLYYYGARYLDPKRGRWMSSDPAMDGMNWYGYCSNNPLKYVDPTGLAEVYADDVNGNPILAYEGRDLKQETHLEIQRGEGRVDQNDSAKLYVGNQVLQEYAGVQSEKNYRSGDQTELEKHDDDLSNVNYPNATLPIGEDYQVELIGETNSYKNAMSITSETAQLHGLEKKGIEKIWNFWIHSTGSKNFPERPNALSWGCQIFSNKDYERLRNSIDGIGFKQGESFGMSILGFSYETPKNWTR